MSTVGDVYDDVASTVELAGGSIHVGYWWGNDDRTPSWRRSTWFVEIICDRLSISGRTATAGHRLRGWGARDPDEATDRRRDHRHRDHVREVTKRMNAAELRNQVKIEYGQRRCAGLSGRRARAIPAKTRWSSHERDPAG
jgi:hypothetical protein